MSFQVPAVKIEDLRAFQTKHFPGTHTHPAEETNQSYAEGGEGEEEEEGNYYYYDEEEDYDLGHYADGAKRTLTDEQIRIFRHSEIHALRREKQAREENEEQREKDLHEGFKNADAGDKSRGGSSGHGSDESRIESVKGNTGSEAATLDYDGGLQVDSRPQHPAPSAPFTRRKIVSYED